MSGSSGFRLITFERRGAVALVGLDDPRSRNAISEAMREELLEALAVVEHDPSLRALVLHGHGANFSSGAHLGEFGRSGSVTSARAVRRRRNVYRRVLRAPLPTVAAVAGAAVGGGLELALCCDVRVAAADARFGLPEVRRGFIPGGGGTQLPGRRAGAGRSARIVLGAETIGAAAGLRLGLAHELAADDAAALERAVELAAEMASEEPARVMRAKALLLAFS